MPLFARHAGPLDDLLRRIGVRGPILILGQPRLARTLQVRGWPTVVASARVRDLRRTSGDRLLVREDALPLASGAVAALIARGITGWDAWEPVVREWARVVHPGGYVVVIDGGSAAELGRRALTGGLTEVEQQRCGRSTITWGRTSATDPGP